MLKNTKTLLKKSSLSFIAILLLVFGIFVANKLLNVERRLAEGTLESWTAGKFYELPNPIPEAKPGTLLRSERLSSTAEGTRAWRILYHSTDLNGQNIIASGTVVSPESTPPSEGRTVVSWGHPTTGIVQRCAPSVGIAPFDLIEGLHSFIGKGYTVVATDYSGMGASGPNSFLVGKTEGNNMLDAVRASQQITETGASNQFFAWGHSQGGQAALFAGQQAAEYAPELVLKGVAVAAPATNLSELLKADINDVSGVTISSYAFTSYSAVYGAKLDDILTPEGVEATPKMASLCLFGQNEELHKIAKPLIGSYIKSDPASTKPWSDLLSDNTPGLVPPSTPLFVAQGEKDKLVRPTITAQFAQNQKDNGRNVTYVPIPDAGHGEVALKALPNLLEWMNGK